MSEPTQRTTGFRPAARRRNRIAAGVALGAIAIGGNVLLYSSVDDSAAVVQAVRDIPAGTQITPDMLRSVDADLDDSIEAISANQLDAISGRFAKVRIVSGSLVSANSLQSDPLVTAGRSVVALQVSRGALPVGLRERSRVQLVVPGARSIDALDAPTVVEGRTVGLPVDANSALGTVSLSVEVDALDAPTIAAADDVRVVLLEQQPDPAFESEGG